MAERQDSEPPERDPLEVVGEEVAGAFVIRTLEPQVEIPSLGVVITSGDGSIEVENQT